MELTYTDYLKVKELTELQQLESNPHEHDEMLFIIIHQAYELWFKQILHEADHLKHLFSINSLIGAQKTLKRINTIFKVLVHQIDILETMTPLEFLSFRDYLASASGFQSYQFRELEFLLGNKSPNVAKRFEFNPSIEAKILQRYHESTIWDDFLQYLHKNSYSIPEEILNRDYTKPRESSKEVQEILLDIYSNSPVIAQFCELLVDLDEIIQEWRYRHVKMVERTIGRKIGTGGSAGADYLKQTLFNPVFPDLWEIRTSFKKL